MKVSGKIPSSGRGGAEATCCERIFAGETKAVNEVSADFTIISGSHVVVEATNATNV
jgi:hypothetical protein